MFGIVTILLAGIVALSSLLNSERSAVPIPNAIGRRMDGLWQIAQSSLKEHRYLRAEKALLTILKLDKRNAAAYNHLGILYSRQREYKDAIECFEIASSIKPTATTLHNLGLVYYETEHYDKAAIALENAIDLDSGLAARHIAYAKVLEKLERPDDAIKQLEKAVEVEKTKQSLTLLSDALHLYGYKEDAMKVDKKIARLIQKSSSNTRVSRPKRVIY